MCCNTLQRLATITALAGEMITKKRADMVASKIKIKKVCEWCGQEFYALKVTTRFCCKKCNERAYKHNLRITQIEEAINQQEHQSTESINKKEYLSVREASTLLGLPLRTTYHLIYTNILHASKISARTTIVRKSDVENMLDSRGYTKGVRTQVKDITEFYTVQEIKDKYNVSESWIYKVGREKKIPRVFKLGKTYWSKEHVDKYILKNKVDDSITEWYSVPEMMEKFNMTLTAVYSFASSYHIPKKKHKREVFYSKKHVDIAKGIAEPEKPQYYTMKEAMAKFNMTRDQIYHYTKVFNVPKIMEGKYVKIAKKELDEALEPPKI